MSENESLSVKKNRVSVACDRARVWNGVGARKFHQRTQPVLFRASLGAVPIEGSYVEANPVGSTLARPFRLPGFIFGHLHE